MRRRLLRDFFTRRRPAEPAATADADHRPAPIDEQCLRLEAAYRKPAAKRRNTH